jgi:hypothetical protein
MNYKTLELLNDFYMGDIPKYIKKATKNYIEIKVDGKTKKITMQDVLTYYKTEACNIYSGCRSLAGIVGDWRPIDRLAKEVLEWFKHSNMVKLRVEAKKLGLTPKF